MECKYNFNMIIIADSGSTKTSWAKLTSKNEFEFFQSIGMNPYHNTDFQIINELEKLNSVWDLKSEKCKIYFYGAGCSKQQTERMVILFKTVFVNSDIKVYSDIFGAARALYGDDSGIASILGTGSNTVIYKNGQIIDGIESMGYILGDEGSGAVLGRTILKYWLRNKFDKKLAESFENKYSINPAIIRENIYQKPFPNRYLASFAPFAHEHNGNSFIRKILINHFEKYFKYHIINSSKSYDYDIGIIGSIGYYFQDIILDLAYEYGLNIKKILASPMDDLINYHTNEL